MSLKDRVYQFLRSLPRITLPAGTVLYHGTNLRKITINYHDKLFLSTNRVEATRHAVRKNDEQKTGRAYLHTYVLINSITVINFTDFTRKINEQKKYKWDEINNIVNCHIDNYKMEIIFFDLLKEHSELVGYHDGCDQCVVLLTNPKKHLKSIDIQYVKSLKQNNCKIKIKRSIEHAHQIFEKYYLDHYINRLNPDPLHIKYDH